VKHVVSVLVVLSLNAVPALAGHDVKMWRIASPIETTRGRWPTPPWAWISNTGTYTENNIPVRCWIDSVGVRVYDTVAFTWAPLHPGNDMMVGGFPDWEFAPANLLYHVTMFTDLEDDSNRTNDTMWSTTHVKLADVRSELYWDRDWGVTVDGYIEQDEWEYWQGADISDTAGQAGTPSPLGSCIFYHADDTRDYAYFAFDIIAVKDRASCDSIVIKTDEDHDGLWEPDSSEGTHSGYSDWSGDSIVFNWLPGMPCPGTSLASSFMSGNLQIEGAIPIGPRRGDLTVIPSHDTTGMAVSYWHGDTCLGWWPQTLQLADWNDPALFGPAYWFYMGTQEPHRESNTLRHADATLCRGVLFLPEASSRKPQATSLLDISGRKVLGLKPGANDVSRLSPGVYFIREAQPQAQAVRKVVLTR